MSASSNAKKLLTQAIAQLGGNRRAEQEELCDLVSETFSHQVVTLIQAGTGTGKSLGYLAAALNQARQHKVVISTATLALQRQLITRDIPTVLSAMEELKRPLPKVALLKGWSNYLCRWRLAAPEEVDLLTELVDLTEDSAPVSPALTKEDSANKGPDANREQGKDCAQLGAAKQEPSQTQPVESKNILGKDIDLGADDAEKNSDVASASFQLAEPSPHQVAQHGTLDSPSKIVAAVETKSADWVVALGASGSQTGMSAQIKRIRKWAKTTKTGDRDDLVPGVNAKVWSQVSVTPTECVGETCPFFMDCFPRLAKTKAQDADLVVTNHSLLGISATATNETMPKYEALIVDEAHELAGRVRAQASVMLSPASLENVIKTAGKHLNKPVETRLQLVKNYRRQLGNLPVGELESLPTDLKHLLHLLELELLSLLKEIGSGGKNDPDRVKKRLIRARLNNLAESVEVLNEFNPLTHAAWVNTESSEQRQLWVGPLEVGKSISTRVFQEHAVVLTSATMQIGGSFQSFGRQIGLEGARRVKSIELTGRRELLATSDQEAASLRSEDENQVQSSTAQIAVQKIESASSPSQITKQSGLCAKDSALLSALSATDKLSWYGVDLGSPFDYQKQGILYLAADLPKPATSGLLVEQLERLGDLIKAAEGGTLGLFSSMRSAQQAAEYLRSNLSYPIFLQGEENLPNLIENYRQDYHACLLGTLSLWQGVDVPGQTNRLVVIDRIPFPRPNDPFISARNRAVKSRGGNGFMEVFLEHAALLMAQGAGRLIRARDDWGVVAVLDQRMAKMPYGRILQKTLPPFWKTSETELVTSALKRLAG